MHHAIPMNAISSLSNADAAVNIAVRDIARASDFYGGLLGLTETGRQGEQLVPHGPIDPSAHDPRHSTLRAPIVRSRHGFVNR